jgi:ADP-heptose:LPS heptosyltransferase
MKKILVFKSDRLGDLINLSSVIYNLKKNFPSSEITIVCSEYNSRIAKYYPDLQNIIIFDKSFFKFSLKYFKKLYLTKYDLLLQLDGKKSSYFCSAIVNSNIKAGLIFIKNKKILNNLSIVKRPNFLISKFFSYLEPCIEDYQISNNKDYHYLNLYLNILKRINLTIYSKSHYLPYNETNNQKFRNYLHIHIDERWKKFDNIFYVNFVDKINNLSNTNKIIITSNFNGNEFYFNIMDKFKSYDNFLFKDKVSIKDLLNIIFYSQTVLSSHSGFIVHAAAAFQKNIIDLVPENINNELDRWVPYNISYKRFNNEDFSKLFI